MARKEKIPNEEKPAKARKKKKDPAKDGDTPDTGAESPFSPGWEGEADQSQDKAAREALESDRKRSLLKKALIFGVPALFLVALVSGFLLFKFDPESKPHSATKLEPVTSIKRPIPVPDYREMLNFLLLYEVDGHKQLKAFRMEFGFQSSNRYQNFKEQNVAFRDTVYSFLQKQNLPGNNQKSWHAVIENELLDFLKVKLPQSQADTIRLTQIEDL